MILAGKLTQASSPCSAPAICSTWPARVLDQQPGLVIDITDEGIDKGVVPAPAGSHPDFFRQGNTASPSRIVYAQEATAADADARDCGGHGTNVASIATGYNARTGAALEDAQGFNYGLGVAPVRPRRRDEDLQLRRQLRRHDIDHGAAQRRVCGRRAHLQQLLGRRRRRRLQHRPRRSSMASCATRSPALPETSRSSRSFSAGNSGAGGNTIGAPAPRRT